MQKDKSSKSERLEQLQTDDYVSSLPFVDRSVRSLIDWLRDPNVDCAELFNAMKGDGRLVSRGFLDRFESPSANIIENLSLIPVEDALPLFTHKLAEAISWLSLNDEYRSNCGTPMWCELFALIRHVDSVSTGSALSLPLFELLSAFDKEANLSLKSREVRRDFTELLVPRQLDNCLMPRWMNLIKDSNSDRCLYASLIVSIAGLLSCPTELEPKVIAEVIDLFEQRTIKAEALGQVSRATMMEKFWQVVEHCGERYRVGFISAISARQSAR